MERQSAGSATSRGLESLLLEWQCHGDTQCLATLIASITPFLERVTLHVLRRHGIHDDSAIDDTTALIFDHLRRLPHEETGERTVMKFDPDRQLCRCTNGALAEAYLYRLAHDRAIDVVRARRRRERRAMPLSQLGAPESLNLRSETNPDLAAEIEPTATNCARLDEAIDRLEPRLRTVIELLIQGKSQVMIAHAVGVCEGTVSRLRAKAITELRRLLAE